MPKFDIYLLWGKNSDGVILRYYGSTTNLIKRKYTHKCNYKKWVKAGRPSNTKYSSVYVLDNGDWKIEKIDEVIGERWEAIKLESEYQKNNECVNVRKELRTVKEWYNDNKDKITQQMKEYRDKNKDEISEKWKQKYNKNKDEISAKKKEKIICECGSNVRKSDLARHLITKKHINYKIPDNND